MEEKNEREAHELTLTILQVLSRKELDFDVYQDKHPAMSYVRAYKHTKAQVKKLLQDHNV